jgi:pimeloyl-ACP methyl ester carboxylesterase
VVTQAIEISGERRVTVDCLGARDGFPVFLLHGTPGSRVGPRPRGNVIYWSGVRLVCYDRPGYGGSDRHEKRAVADAAWDVLAIADKLGLERFSVIGRSGGGPHALACAALLDRQRVQSVVVLGGIAPPDADELAWTDGMTESNVAEYELTRGGLDWVVAQLTKRINEIRKDPESLLHELDKELTGSDRKVVNDVGIRRQLIDTYTEALRAGPYGWIDDVLAFRRPWGFDLGKINVPVLLWHGEEDVFSPLSHTQWLAEKIPTAHLHIESGAAHFNTVEILPKLLAQLKAGRTSEGLRVKRPHQPALSS